MRLPEVGTGEEYEFWVDSETGETIKIILWTHPRDPAATATTPPRQSATNRLSDL